MKIGSGLGTAALGWILSAGGFDADPTSASSLAAINVAVIWVPFVIAVIGWVIFYYTDLAALAQALGALFGVGISGWSDASALAVLRSYGLWALGAFVLSLPVVPFVSEKLPVLSPITLTTLRASVSARV